MDNFIRKYSIITALASKRFFGLSLIVLVVKFAVLVSLLGCKQTMELSNQEFRRLPPFHAKLIKFEEIPCNWEEGSLLSAMTLRDYRITIEKEDGLLIIIKRVSAVLGTNVNWPEAIPLHILHPTLIVGCCYTFPADLYKIHEVSE